MACGRSVGAGIPDCRGSAGFPRDGRGEDDCTPAITPRQQHAAVRRRPRGAAGVIVSPPVSGRGDPQAHPRAVSRPWRGRRTMDAFTAGILQRIESTRSDLDQARRSGDEFLAEVEQSALEDLHRLAAEHGVQVSAV
ncbi:hypothetical protein GCM10009544_49120 [Streptomyces stramineus]|uniref:Uncharacterized protein n=2 Tax=Streptomyces TaxID=1883 RepID=A0ABP3KJV7_9ACTN